MIDTEYSILYIQSSTRGIISNSILGNKPSYAARLIAPYF
ncbi:hypothetical protein [Inovirus D_HF3_10]|nr:hypothetical protein [Inovirus D_HF3_10]